MKTALVYHPFLRASREETRDAPMLLEEAVRLTETLGLQPKAAETIALKEITPATYIGKGKAAEIGEVVKLHKPSVIVMDTALTPGQQKNLEDATKCKVIDRTGLILEIFGARARTAEGKLQVELAAFEYQKGRLVRAWTHLERQRGGFGFAGGPGETQIELDRRKIRDRISAIKKELEKVKNTRALQRKKRAAVPYPVVALVGYTNAGKSTLFNRLTKANVLAEDKLFATLDPTMRALTLPSGKKVMLSDTVGFISRLPTQLVAAFRATLEEVLQASLLLHVRDATAENGEAQKKAVEKVLKELGLGAEKPMLEVLNKVDSLADSTEPTPGGLRISAHTGFGIAQLLKKIDSLL